MLIASDFKDYYDSGAAFGIDKTCVYARRNSVQPYHTVHAKKLGYDESYSENTVIKFAVGFCGTIYPAIQIRNDITKINDTFYDPQTCIKFLRKIGFGLKQPEQKYRYYYRDPRYDEDIRSEDGIKRFFERPDRPHYWKSYEPLFLEHKTPIFRVGYNIVPGWDRHSQLLEINPNLKKIKFQKIKDPTTAFQDIFMYISGVLGTPERPMVEIEDKYKQQQHGHDDPYSFKRSPTKKRR